MSRRGLRPTLLRVLLLALVLPVLSATGQGESSRGQAWWHQYALTLHREAADAQARYDEVMAEYTRLRTSHRDRGEPKVEILKQKEEAEAALRAAEERLAGLEDEARRAGVPPGWVRIFPEDLESD